MATTEPARRTPEPGAGYRLRPAVLLLPLAVTVLEVDGQRVHFALPDGRVADLHEGAFRGLYEPTEEPDP